MIEHAPVWIHTRDTLAIHERLLALHGRPPGLRDASLLESALAHPRRLQAYSEGTVVIEMTAAYTVGIVRNDQFVDGNK